MPAFEEDEVELLVSAVEKALEHLKQANERLGGQDRELLEFGRRYAVILGKLKPLRMSDAVGLVRQ